MKRRFRLGLPYWQPSKNNKKNPRNETQIPTGFGNPVTSSDVFVDTTNSKESKIKEIDKTVEW